MRHFVYILTGVALAALASCSPQRYATVPSYEDDDIYYNPGDVYITESQAATGTAEEVSAAEADPGYDYYDPQAMDQGNVTINNYYSNGWSPNWNRFNSPGLSVSYMSGWNRPGMFSINYTYGFGNPYYYGYSAFGYSPWGPGYDPFWYDPFYSPFYYPTPICYSPFWNPYGGYGWGYGTPWYASPYGYNPYYGYNSWNNPWWAGDAWANSNYHYQPYNPIYTSSSNGSSYTGGTVYSANGKNSLKPLVNPNGDDVSIERPAVGKDDRVTQPVQVERNTDQPFDYWTERPQQTNSTQPAATTRPNSTTTQPSQRNNGWNIFDFGGGNDQPTTRPSSGNDRPVTRPSGGGSNSRTVRPSSGRSSGGSSGGSRSSGGRRK